MGLEINYHSGFTSPPFLSPTSHLKLSNKGNQQVREESKEIDSKQRKVKGHKEGIKLLETSQPLEFTAVSTLSFFENIAGIETGDGGI